MIIRPENESDHKAIEALTYLAFENHPHHEVGAKPTEHVIVNTLRENSALSLSLVAEDDTGIIGHIAFSPVTIGKKQCGWYGLGPVSVVPKHQGVGVGSKLILAGLDILNTQNAMGTVLLGDPQYYGRFGFKRNTNLVLPDVPPEYFLALSFSTEKTLLTAGTVNYHSAFN